jgi:hypothetical protein
LDSKPLSDKTIGLYRTSTISVRETLQLLGLRPKMVKVST